MRKVVKQGALSVVLASALMLFGVSAQAEPMAAEESMGPEPAPVLTEQTNEVASDELVAQAEDNAEVEAQAAKPVLRARGHVQNKGWIDSPTYRRINSNVNKNARSILVGSTGEGLRLEALNLWIENADGNVEGRSHIQNIGWTDWEEMSQTHAIGTEHQGLSMEALHLRLPKALIDAGYTLHYRVHVQDIGWLGDISKPEGYFTGTAGLGKRIEAVELYLAEPGESVNLNYTYVEPGTGAGGVGVGIASFFYKTLSGQAHVQNIGWQEENYAEDAGELCRTLIGTTGKALRVEAIKLNNPALWYPGNIVYEAHVQNIGWQGERKNGEIAGTSGQSLRLEAIRVRLTDWWAEQYDVYYRVHAQDIGWMGWAKNGEDAGTAGFGKRLEAIEVIYVPKGGKPFSMDKNIVSVTNEAFRKA